MESMDGPFDDNAIRIAITQDARLAIIMPMDGMVLQAIFTIGEMEVFVGHIKERIKIAKKIVKAGGCAFADAGHA